MQPLLAVATILAAVQLVNSETAYLLQPVQSRAGLSTGWGWRPVKTVTLALPSLSSGWGWKPKPQGISFGVYGGLRIGPSKQGWGWPQKQQGWGWGQQKQQGWGWKPQGWGWKQQGWGWDDDDEDDYRAITVDGDSFESSSEEVADDDNSGSAESEEEEADSAEADAPLDLRKSIGYEPIY